MNNYFNIPKASASYLKFLEKNNPLTVEQWMNKDTRNKSTSFGSLVDCLYTEPETFEDKYIVEDDIPNGDAAEIVRELYEQHLPFESVVNLDYYEHIIENICLQPRWTKDKNAPFYKSKAATTGVKKVLELEDYWNFLIDAEDKEIISTALYEKAKLFIANIVRDLPLLNAVLMNPNYTNSQMIIESDVEGIEVKAKLDFVVTVDEEIEVENGIIFYPDVVYNIDLKTTSAQLWNCSYEIRKYGYDKSMSFYSYLLAGNDKVHNKNIVNNYLIFVNEHGASTIRLSEELLFNATHGIERDNFIGTWQIPTNLTHKSLGWMNLLEHYKYYLENGFNKHVNLINGIPNLIE